MDQLERLHKSGHINDNTYSKGKAVCKTLDELGWGINCRSVRPIHGNGVSIYLDDGRHHVSFDIPGDALIEVYCGDSHTDDFVSATLNPIDISEAGLPKDIVAWLRKLKDI